MLGSFIIILFVFLGANVGAIAFMYTQFDSELEMMTSELKKTIPYYNVEDSQSIVKVFWDQIQPNLQVRSGVGGAKNVHKLNLFVDKNILYTCKYGEIE